MQTKGHHDHQQQRSAGMKTGSCWNRIIAVYVLNNICLGWPGFISAMEAPISRRMNKAEKLQHEASRLHERGDHQAAILLIEQACAILEGMHTIKFKELATCLNNLGFLYRKEGDYESAERHYERALHLTESDPGYEDADLIIHLENLAIMYQAKGNPRKAADLYERVLATKEAALGAEPMDAIITLVTLADLHTTLGDYESAESLLDRSLYTQENVVGPHHPDIVPTLVSIAHLRVKQGRLREAESLYLRALEIDEKALGPNHIFVSGDQYNLASLFLLQGAYGKAEPLLEQSLSAYEKILGPNHADVAAILEGLGTLHLDQDQYQRAERFFLRALEIRRKTLHPKHVHVASSINNLAAVYQAQRRFAEAELLYEEALAIREEALGPDHPDVASSTNDLGLAHLAQENNEQADVLFNQALDIRMKTLGPGHLSTSDTLSCLGLLRWRQGDIEAAAVFFARALIVQETVFYPHHPLLMETLGSLSRVYAKLGRRDDSARLYRRLLDGQDQHFMRSFTIADDAHRLAHGSRVFGLSNGILALHLQSAPRDRNAAELALATVLRRKGRMVELAARSHAVVQRASSGKHQDILHLLSIVQSRYAALINQGSDTYSTGEWRSRVTTLQHEQDVLWSTIRALSPQVDEFLKVVTVSEVQTRISGDSALVEYARYRPSRLGRVSEVDTREGDRYAAYIVFPHSFTWVDLGLAAPIDAQIHSFRDAITRRADTTPHAHALYTSVMKPVVDRLGLTTRLFIAPDGDLNLVPFDALVDEYDNYLVERFQLHYLTSGRDLLRPWTHESPADGPVVVLANPAGAELPGTEHEASLLASIFPDAVTMQHDAASETQLRTHERPRILHLATHGTFGTGRPGHTLFDATPDDDLFRAGTSVFDGLPPTQLDNPMLYSWLELATPPALPEDPSTVEDILDADDDALLDDGKLTAYEVSGWDLRGTELVTLSACDTAQGTYQQGEGILGLRRAFAIAGAQTQVMSLWKVSDTATAKLMASYYRRLLAGEGRSEAMRNTQLELLRDPATRHPRDWAAFVVVGEWGPLSSVTAPPKADPPPIDARPRGCQATVAAPSDALATILIVLPALALTRRRRRPRA